MKTSGNTVLITGGGTGIGFELAKILTESGNNIIICGRRLEKLRIAKEIIPKIHIKTCDLSDKKERERLCENIVSEFKSINIIINNAGIQQRIDFKACGKNLFDVDNEIETNLVAPMHLSALFIPFLMQQKEAAIVNISSGLGFIPISVMPVYCSTKAAMHSFSLSLRYQLKNTSVKVFEVIPPMVDTELDGGGREAHGQNERGIKPVIVAVDTLKALKEDRFEIAIGMAKGLVVGSRIAPHQLFKKLNR